MKASFRDYAELARLSNLPTTFSNVLVGCAAGAAAASAPAASAPDLDWPRVLAVWFAIACFYIAGMALNDVVDAQADARERPKRPIPSGRISRREALVFTIALFAAGLAMLGFLALDSLIAGLILVAVIIAYDLLHARLAGAVVLMGLSRGLVYVVAALAVGGAGAWPLAWRVVGILAGSLALYTIIFTFIARSETEETLDRRRLLAPMLAAVALAPMLVLQAPELLWMVMALAIMLGWLGRSMAYLFGGKTNSPNTKNAVMGFIAGICLIDGFFLTLLNQPGMALLALVCFLITIAGHRYIAGT